jgi:nucleotide-binding universal stress UspA family protein
MQAARRINEIFPAWDIKTETYYGSPASRVLDKAAEWKPDLIVVGSHGRSAIGRLFLGSVSQRIVTEAACSVRIGRGRVEAEQPEIRILVATDGLSDSEAAVKAVAARVWPIGTQVRLLTAIGPFYSGTEIDEEKAMAREIQNAAAEELSATGLEISFVAKEGDPRKLIVDEAEKWGADNIFVGSSGMKRIERILLGSVSAAVSARAHCSVEVVRKHRDETEEKPVSKSNGHRTNH